MALQRGAVASSEEHFAQVAGQASRAIALFRHPPVLLASLLPFFEDDIAVARKLVEAARLSGDAGLAAVRAARAMGTERRNLAGSLYKTGRVDLTTIRHTIPFIRTVDRLVDRARDVLASAPTPRLSSLHRVLMRARSELHSARDVVDRILTLLGVLPEVVGASSRRQYLLAFQALGEARGTGGLVGFYGILTTDAGRVHLSRIGPIASLQPAPIPPVQAPAWFRRSYGSQMALRQIQQATLTPNFPVAARVLLRMYEFETRRTLDGVIAMDPVTLKQLMNATGAISVRGFGRVTAKNVARSILRDSYLKFDEPAQNRFLSVLIRNFWSRVSRGHFDNNTMVRSVLRAIRTRHLKIYSSEHNEREAFRYLEADGAFTPWGPNLQLIFHNNYAPNKVDYFLRREINTTVRLTSRGAARVTTTVRLHNRAPKGPPSLLLGPNVYGRPTGDPPGLNRMLISFLLPKAAQGERLSIQGRSRVPFLHSDTGFPVISDIVDIPPGQRRSLRATYRFPAGTSSDDIFVFTLFPQTTVRPDRYSLKIQAPTGALLREIGSEQISALPVFERSGRLLEEQVVKLKLVKPTT